MNTNDWYTREKLVRIKQEEVLRDARNAHMFPTDFKAVLANHKQLLIAGVLIVAVILLAISGMGV